MWEFSGDFVVSYDDLAAFKFLEEGAAGEKIPPAWSTKWTRVFTRSSILDESIQDPTRGWLSVEEEDQYNSEEWESCIDKQHPSLSSASSTEDHLTIAICGPPLMNNTGEVDTFPAALRYLGSTQRQFQHLLGKMEICPAFLGVVKNSSPVATMQRCMMDGRECTVYLLRVSNSTACQSAIAITHIPGTAAGGEKKSGSRTTALILGYDDESVSRFRTALQARKPFIFEPRAVVIAFLEAEKDARFLQVRERVAGLSKILHNMSASAASHTTTNNLGRHRDVDDNIGLYLNVSMLKTDALQAWRGQLVSLKAELGEDKDPRLSLYLDRLSGEYEHRINRCEVILQGASLAYQMETTYLSRNDTSIAINDGKRMKAIAALTMVFLPATFTATLMAVPQIQHAIESSHAFRNSEWLWYLVLSVSFTALALVPYTVWNYMSKRGGERCRTLRVNSDENV